MSRLLTALMASAVFATPVAAQPRDPQPSPTTSTRTYTSTVEIPRRMAERLCRGYHLSRGRLIVAETMSAVAMLGYSPHAVHLAISPLVADMETASFCEELERDVTPVPRREEPEGTPA